MAAKKKAPKRKGALLSKKDQKELLGMVKGSKRTAKYPKAKKKKSK